MGMYVKLTKLADDQARATYSFPGGEEPPRTLVLDRAEERIWPEDGNSDPVFQAAARTLAKALREHDGQLPDTLYHRS